MTIPRTGTFGARLFEPAPKSAAIGWLVRAGRDFPDAAKERLKLWSVSLEFRDEPEHDATRGRLVYQDSGHNSE